MMEVVLVNKLSAAVTIFFLSILTLGFSVQARGNRSNWIQVTKGEQLLRVISPQGTVLYSTPVITGRTGKPTYSGTFFVQRLQVASSPNRRKSFEPEYKWGRWIYYKSYVWAPISASGIGIHDADWWPGWNASQRYAQRINASGQGSHGCINVPPANIWRLLSYMYTGMRVVVR